MAKKRHASDNIVVDNNKGVLKESFNRLKDNIIYYSNEGERKVYQIESSIAGEGKSFVLVNLAVSLAQSKKRVVLIDLDFRKPKVHREFRMLNDCGLADYMRGTATKEYVIKKTEFGVDVVTSGRNVSNPSIILTSLKFKRFIEDLKKTYDFILLDSPPVLQVSDYILISKVIDAAIFVVSCGKVKKKQVAEAVSYLRRNNIDIVGTVMSFAENMHSTYSSSYYYRRYMYTYYGPYSSTDLDNKNTTPTKAEKQFVQQASNGSSEDEQMLVKSPRSDKDVQEKW